MTVRNALLLVGALAAALAPIRAAAAPEDVRPLAILWKAATEGAAGAAEVSRPGTALRSAPYIMVAWRVTDFALTASDAALDREAQNQNAQIAAIAGYKKVLETWAKQGVDMRHDRRAREVKDALRELGLTMSAENLDGGEFLLRAVQRNFRYAVTYAALDQVFQEAVSGAAGWAVGRAPYWVDGRQKGWFGRVLKARGWTRLADREAAAKGLPGQYMQQILAAEANLFVDKVFGEAKGDLWGQVYDILNQTTPREAWPTQARIAAARADAAIALQPMAAMPVPQPIIAMRAAPVAMAPLTIRAISPDPVAAVVAAEDRHLPGAAMRPGPVTVMRPRDEPSMRPAEPEMRPAAPSEADVREAQRQAERKLYWHQQWMCAGAGNKPGCGQESWDGDRKGLHQ